jgi:hypothetical protein
MRIQSQSVFDDDDFYFYALDLEREWKQSLPRLNDKELLQIFPEIKDIIPTKLQELQIERRHLETKIKSALIEIQKQPDEFTAWLMKEGVKVSHGQELLRVDRTISKLSRLYNLACGRKIKGWISEDQIQTAQHIPIRSLIHSDCRRSGQRMFTLCPLHKEKTPSFCIYVENNTFYCYGCNQGGNVIKFVMLLHGLNFKEAVKYLLGDHYER